MELSREQIIKAFENCEKGICTDECPYILNDDISRCNKIKLHEDIIVVTKELVIENKMLQGVKEAMEKNDESEQRGSN